MAEERDLYEILQVSPNADPEVIEAAYRRLARKHHPDISPSPESAQRMRALTHAYEVLRDPDRRAAYDPGWAARRLQEVAARQAADVERRPSGTWALRRMVLWIAWGAAALLLVVVALPALRAVFARGLVALVLVGGLLAIAWYAWWLYRTGRG